MKKNIVFIGPPGCGKGTQAHLLKEKLLLDHVSTGALLRQEVARGTPAGHEVKDLIEKGMLIGDDLMLRVLTSYLDFHPSESGFIFDGFPRMVSQAEWLREYLSRRGENLQCVIYFSIDEEILTKRLSGRFTCTDCGATYNEYYKRPRHDGVCDVCGSSRFSRRADDAVEHVTKRLHEYHLQTKPLLPFYETQGLLRRIDVMKSPEEVSKEILAVVEA
ncbi:MAG: adenylate kinase [Alphaproteobacteria bacterium]